MPDVSIQINNPALIAGQYFQVRYRSVGSPTWTDITPKYNTPFLISGINAGEYELEVSVVLGGSPPVICDPVVYNFTVETLHECPEFDIEITYDGSQSAIEITDISVSDPYPCGYEIVYTINGASFGTVVMYNTLPSDIIIPVPSPPSDYKVDIYGLLCNGGKVLCFSDVIEAPEGCDTGGSIDAPNTRIIRNQQGYFYITIPYTQSTPPSAQITVSWLQNGIILSGSPDSGATVFNAGSLVYVPINPNFALQPEIVGSNPAAIILRYQGVVYDNCGFVSEFSVQANLEDFISGGGVTPPSTELINVMVNNYTIGSPLTYTIAVKERATSTNIAQNGVGRTINSGQGNVITTNGAKNYDLYDIDLTLTTSPYPKRFVFRWHDGIAYNNVGSFTVNPAGTQSGYNLHPMYGNGTLYVDILDEI